MVWKLADLREIDFAHAKVHYAAYRDLLVPTGYVCVDRYRLGNWISNQRNNYNHPTRYRYVIEKQTVRLENIGMVWKRQNAEKLLLK